MTLAAPFDTNNQKLTLRQFGLVLSAVAYGATPAVIRELKPQPAVPASLAHPAVRRVRAVLFDFQQFLTPARKKTVRMTLFPDTALTVRWTAAEPASGVITWTGTVVGAPHGYAVLNCTARSVTANITRGDGLIYRIQTTDEGIVWIREIDQARFLPER